MGMQAQNRALSPGSIAPAARPGSGAPRLWLAVAALLLVAGATLAYFVDWDPFFARSNPPKNEPSTEPLSGDLLVGIDAPGRLPSVQTVDEPGAVPVRDGEQMMLQVRLNQPAYMYLVWIDGQGRTLPLYPWNMDEIEVRDAKAPPPLCRPGKFVMNPMIFGKGWRFEKGEGMETVLLLARRTPLPDDVAVGALLSDLPPVKVRQRDEVVILGVDGGGAVSTLLSKSRGPGDLADKAEQPLRALLARLQGQFELIRAVRFAHED